MKKLAAVLIVLAIFFIMPAPVFADSEADNEAYDRLVSEINDGLSFEGDDEVQQILDENNISVDEPSAVEDIKAESILSSGYEMFIEALKKPLVMLGKIIAVAMLCVLVGSLSPEGGLDKTFSIVCVLATVLVLSDTVTDSFYLVQSSIERLNSFMASYIPIFSSVAAAGGNISSSGGYYGIMLLICEGAAVIAGNVLIPFLSAVLAVTIVSAVNPNLQFSSVAESVKKAVIWLLGIVMTLFVGLLSIQSFAGSAADNLSSRALKFAASSFIPVIGGSISEAYSAVKGSLGVIRTSVGVVGIIILVIIVAKPIITVIAVKVAVWLGKIINDVLGNRECSELLKNINSVLSIGLSIIIAYSVVFVIATSVIMLTAMNLGA